MAKIIIEADDGRNSTIDWKPGNIKLRSRFSTLSFKPMDMLPNGIRRMPDIPGQHIELDTETKSAKVFDPLSDPGNKGLLNRINTASADMSAMEMGNRFQGIPTRTYTLKSRLEFDTWVYWIRRYVTLGYFKLLEGELPHVKGKVKCNFDDFTEKAVKERSVDTQTEEVEAELAIQDRSVELAVA